MRVFHNVILDTITYKGDKRMKSKKVITLVIINIVFALSIIGLAVGLVLTAQQAILNNSMSIRYEVTGASCDITAYGIKYDDEGYVNKSSIHVRENANDTPTEGALTKNIQFGTTSIGSFIFSSADKDSTLITATGRATYFFEIKNTADTTSTEILQVKAEITNLEEADNVRIRMGLSESATEETSAIYNIGTGGETATIVVILDIKDPAISTSYNCAFSLNIGYELSDVTNMGDANSSVVATTATNLEDEIASYATTQATRYYDASGNEVATSSEATAKVVSYPTIDIYYGDVATSNSLTSNSNSISAPPTSISGYKVTNKRYIQLANDIDLTNSTINTKFIGSIVLDGGIYDAEGNLIVKRTLTVSEENLGNDGYIFNTAYDSIFKNINLCIDGDMAGLVTYTRGEYVTFENVTISTPTEGSYINVDSADNNESPFMVFNYADKLNFINCANEANYLSTASYYGIFVGGYCVGGRGEVTFDNCSNSGDIHTFGTVGILFGNGTYRPTGGDNGYVINNFVNTGTIYYTPAYNSSGVETNTPHILTSTTVVNPYSYSFKNDEKAYYDQNIEGVITTNANFVQHIASKFTATSNYKDLVITSKDNNNLPAGNYQMIFTAFFYNKDYNSGINASTSQISIPVQLDIENTTSQTFEDIMLPIIDKGTYLAQGYTIDSSATWTPIMDGAYKYTKTDIAYVVDTNGEYVLHNLKDSAASTKLTAISNSGEILGCEYSCLNYAIKFNIMNMSTSTINLEFLDDNGKGLGTIHDEATIISCNNYTNDKYYVNAYYYYDNTTDPAEAEFNFNIILPNTGTRYRVKIVYTDSTGTTQTLNKYFDTTTASTTTITAEDLDIPLSVADGSAPLDRFIGLAIFDA